ELSRDGEKYVDEEMKRALFGVKQMKEVMEKNGKKHEHLMKSLRHSSEKKQGAVQLAKEVQQKLGEAELQCQEALKSSWEECKPCLRDTCKSFYTSTCRRGFSTFSTKVKEFIQKMSSQFSLLDNQDLIFNQTSESFDIEVVQIENSFNQLLSEVGSLYAQSMALFDKMREKFDQAFQAMFTSDPQAKGLIEKPLSPAPQTYDSGFLDGLGLEDVLESFLDFGRTVFDDFSSVITEVFDDLHKNTEDGSEKEKGKELLFPTLMPSQRRQLCRDLRRQSSQCWQLQTKCQLCQTTLLQECPRVTELHTEQNEVSRLVNVSSQQYDEILHIVQRHTEDTVGWLANMAARFGWVAELANTNVESENVFTVSTVKWFAMIRKKRAPLSLSDTTVEVNILDSHNFTLTVPGELEVQDPAFINYVAQEALRLYKRLVR
ncbi:CLUL1 protein, partial [Amia calva]|nr:CLUL1 protein [Amia calva]